MGETRVDLLHLLEDLRDAYAGSLEETILGEIVANSLDSGARAIHIECNAASSTLTVVDDGSGMLRRDLARYHDIAASTKTRGVGIGFAGVGIKLGLLLCEDVFTETRRGIQHVASRWRLASRHKAPWKWEPPIGLVPKRGTAVRLRLSNALSPLLDPGFVESTLRRHFTALLDPRFATLLDAHYPGGIRFEVNGRVVEPEYDPSVPWAAMEIRLPRKRKASAEGFLARHPLPLPEDRRGVAVSTLGKTIRVGWDWLGVTPATPDRICGLIEVPALAECLTLSKSDFIRSGARGAVYLSYRKAIQEVVSRQLAEWGDARDAAEESRRRAARPVERDLERVLVDLATSFPLLAALVERHDGGQRRLPVGIPGSGSGTHVTPLAATVPAGSGMESGREAVAVAEPESPAESSHAEQHTPPSVDGHSSTPSPLPGASGPRRPQRYGLRIQFDSRPDDAELARLVETTVWVNEAHPAFLRAVASRSEGYHVALSVAMSLAPLAVEPAEERRFVTAFLEQWGKAIAQNGKPSRRGHPARRR